MHFMNMNPTIFTDGTDFYKDLSQKYKQHKFGLFILGPSGSGKTHFCKNQQEPHWIDGDALWETAGAHPHGAWWLEPIETINRVDARSDVITMEAKQAGFWIVGASNYWLKPDAIVIPDWETHKQYIETRHKNNYDGGATPDDHDQVLGHIEIIKKWNTDHGVPQFKSIQEAADALTKDS